MRFKLVLEDFMPIRIRHSNNDISPTQHSDFSAIKLETTPYSQESYMVLEAIIGGLCGSI